MAFLAPLVGAVFSGGIATQLATTVLGAGVSALMRRREGAAKRRAIAAGAGGQQQTGIVPLPDESAPGVRYAMDKARRGTRARRGYQSTLVTGQLGDSRAPPVSAPLVLGG